MLAEKESDQIAPSSQPDIAIIANDKERYQSIVDHIKSHGFNCQIFTSAKVALQEFGSFNNAIVFISWNLEKTKVKNYVDIFSNNLNFYCVAFAEVENTQTSAELVSSGIEHTMQFPYTQKNFLMCINKVIDDKVRTKEKDLRRQEISESFKNSTQFDSPAPLANPSLEGSKDEVSSSKEGDPLIHQTSPEGVSSTAENIKFSQPPNTLQSNASRHFDPNPEPSSETEIPEPIHPDKPIANELPIIEQQGVPSEGSNNIHFTTDNIEKAETIVEKKGPAAATKDHLQIGIPVTKLPSLVPDTKQSPDSTLISNAPTNNLFLIENSNIDNPTFNLKASIDSTGELPNTLDRRKNSHFRLNGNRSADPKNLRPSDENTSRIAPTNLQTNSLATKNDPFSDSNNKHEEDSQTDDHPLPPPPNQGPLLESSEIWTRYQLLALIIGIGVGTLFILTYLISVLFFR